MTPQYGALRTDDSRVIIYNCNVFIIQDTALKYWLNRGECSLRGKTNKSTNIKSYTPTIRYFSLHTTLKTMVEYIV